MGAPSSPLRCRFCLEPLATADARCPHCDEPTRSRARPAPPGRFTTPPAGQARSSAPGSGGSVAAAMSWTLAGVGVGLFALAVLERFSAGPLPDLAAVRASLRFIESIAAGAFLLLLALLIRGSG